jgi:EAL domain-containing protein (putative c-di-GMP-specific phosphodiesterase class I)
MENICFEITETAVITNLTYATAFIETMHKQGCSFALDDFGTGFSSFAYLKHLPVHYLKIDGVFVKGIVDDPIDYAMDKSIHEVGRVMGQKTVAEFVKNNEITLKLKEIGVDYYQGYGIAKPCPIEELRLSCHQFECKAIK